MSARYYRNTTLLRWAGVGLVLQVLLDLAYAVFLVWALVSIPGAELMDLFYQSQAFIYLPTVLPALVLILVWTYRASANAGHLQPDPDRISPGWAVGWSFIPFMNLWKPYVAMRQIWNSSEDPKGELNRAAPLLLRAWWGLFIFGVLIAQIAAQWTVWTTEYDTPLQLNVQPGWHDLLSTPFGVASNLCFLQILRRITRMQNERVPVVDGGAGPDSSSQS